MNFYICLHNTYHSVEVALLTNNSIIKKIPITKEEASALLIPKIDKLLTSNNLTISDLTCLIINQGPAPFTTLRTMIATVNGISFATHIPLVGVDGLIALLKEYSDKKNYPTVALLNAFNKAVYYAIAHSSLAQPTIGYDSINTLLESLKTQFIQTPIRFIGNACLLYKNEIIELFGDNALLDEPVPEVASIECIIKLGLEQWNDQETITIQLEPLYLKKSVT